MCVASFSNMSFVKSYGGPDSALGNHHFLGVYVSSG